MGINLALSILEGTAEGGHHGGRAEASDELMRYTDFMTSDELRRARLVGDHLLAVVVTAALVQRKRGGLVWAS